MGRKGKLQFRVDVKGPLRGRCNICGEDGPLTEDHTPPKSCGGFTAAHVRAFRETIGEEQRAAPKSRPQRRVTVRSLCVRCNSEVLGHLYDPALADLCRQVSAAVDGVLQLPATYRVRMRPAAVMRSVLGHMAAREVDRYAKGSITEPLRDYMLNPNLPLPDALKFYWWFYPRRRQVFVRDGALLLMGIAEPFTFWLLKFFPLAFMVTFDATAEPMQTESLNFYRAVPVNAELELTLRLRPPVHEHWPEHPTKSSAIMYGQGAQVADGLRRVQR